MKQMRAKVARSIPVSRRAMFTTLIAIAFFQTARSGNPILPGRYADPEAHVRLRFVFDDPAHPDFEMDLWLPQDQGRHGRLDADEALHEANRWMARMESLLRRPVAKPTMAPLPPPVRVQAQPPAGPLFDDGLDEDLLEDDPEDAIS